MQTDEVVSGGSGCEGYEDVSPPSSPEGSPPPLPPKMREPRKPGHKAPRQLLSEDEEGEKADSPKIQKIKRNKNTLPSKNGSGAKTAGAAPKTPRPRPTSLPLRHPINLMMSKEMEFQKAMDIAVTLLQPLKVDLKKLTMCPDTSTLECFTKGVQAWLTDQRTPLVLTFSTNKTFKSLVARLLFDMVVKAANLTTGAWNPSGCFVWRHKSNEERGLHCFHGSPMISKEHIIELDLTSENAQRALKETPEKTKVVANKWGRQVVQIKNDDAACCFADAGCSGGNFSAQSCGLFYTEGAKALMAFRQISAYQHASYPSMEGHDELMLAPLKCDCNWAYVAGAPLHGRQLCKVTPFAMSGTSNIDASQVEDKKILATLQNPAVLVFQCCNPVYRGSKANAAAGKNCDFKISGPDVMSALQLAKKIWRTYCQDYGEPPLRFQEFKWSTQYQVQNVVLPTGFEDESASPF